ncbi:MAG: ATP-dependent Clp protease ATP-binding subunit [Chitinophagales bacterium]|nr:ATP-dependent Clp protease ATP-binding subunit [Chitinophagales bacterium]
MSFTDSVKKAVHIAQAHAKDFSHTTFGPAHLLKALLHKEVGLRAKLEASGKDVFYLDEWADVRIETYTKGKPTESPKPDAQAEAVFAEADNIRLKFGADDIDAIHLLISIATPGVGFSYEQLKTFGLAANELVEATIENNQVGNVIETGKSNTGNAEKKTGANALLKFCTDKTADARTGKIDEIIGRDKEIRMMAEILGRRSKPNVIIVGEPGVGKSSLVDGFALNVAKGQVPDNLKNVTLFELDFGSLVAGASYKGEVEDRLKNIVKELKQFDKAILYIDEIHQLLDKNGGASGAANLLKPELARGELTVIGATTNEEYRKYIESDDAFSRRFETVRVEEPDDATAIRMLRKIVPYYEKHHSLTVDKEALPEAIRLARRFAKERSLPDAAIDLLDRTMASVKFASNTAVAELQKLDEALTALLSSNEGEIELLNELKWFHKELHSKVSHVLTGQLEDETDINTLETSDSAATYLKDTISKLAALAENIKSHVDKTDIAAMIAHKTGIPIGKLGGQERERLMGMEGILQKRVVGQDHAIKSLSEAILEARSGLNKQGQPIGSFFLLGPTGTGKTEVAKSLAEFLFQTESAMIRFDMSEFKEEHSAALLYGAPPGYVGYEEGGVLVNKIRQQPYAIVLFDEIEKAHPSVFDIFLQILDEGKMHDRLGKEGDFSNAVILFTSNIGAENIIESFGKGVVPKSSDLLEIMANYFRPEFLARLTEIVPFAPISEKNVVKIFEIHVKSLYKSLERQGITLDISPEAKEKIALMGFTPRYGARPLTGMIRTQLRRPLSRMIIAGEIGKGSHVKLSVVDGELKWEQQ